MRFKRYFPLIITVLSVTCVVGVEGSRILLLPASFVSHTRQLVILGEKLIQDGHDVYLGLSENFPPMDFITKSKIAVVKHAALYVDVYTMPKEKLQILLDPKFIQVELFRNKDTQEEFLNLCLNPFTDEQYFKYLKEKKFDLVIVDTFPLNRCLLIMAYNLGVPFVSVATAYDPWLMRTPALPSFVPTNTLSETCTDKMSFLQRMKNLWNTIDWNSDNQMKPLDDTLLRPYIKTKEKPTLNELAAKSLLFFVDVDPVLDYPKPTMPNEINIGGFAIKPSEPLANDLKHVVESSEYGVIVMSFGTMWMKIPESTLLEYMKAFSQLRYTVVWKYEHDIPYSLPNVKVYKWLPQNDLLAHPNTKMFITHCGNGGQFEALYHAVPMVGMPLFGDQPYNCKRMEAHGYGICLSGMYVKSDEIVSVVNEIADNVTYSNSIQLASAIYKDNPQQAQERFLYWINHVLKFGGKHLRSHALDMPWYQYLMLDILGFVFVVSSCTTLIIAIFVQLSLKYFCCKKECNFKQS